MHSGTGISGPAGITAGPDGALWFTNVGNNSIGRITTAGKITDYTGPGIADPQRIVVGPDGRCGSPTSVTSRLGGSPPLGWSPTTQASASTHHSGSRSGSDGALWFTNEYNHSIGRITTTGKIKVFTGTGISGPLGIAAGPDGALWFTNICTTTRSGRITTKGMVTNTPAGASAVRTGSRPGLTAPCGSPSSRSIGRISTTGVITNYSGGARGGGGSPPGPDGALWFTKIE